MDTSRIIINTIDNSTSLIENPTEITGFTVVKAEKGPTTPIRVSSGGASALKDLFGVSSKEYPEMFEVETFNKEFDVWVSAPYTKAKVPVSYVTPDGIFASANKVDYNLNVEDLINGNIDPDIDDVNILGITAWDSENTPELLLDTRYMMSNNVSKTISHKEGETTVIDYKAEDLSLKDNLYPGYFNNLNVTYLQKDGGGKMRLKSMSRKGLKINIGLPKQLFNLRTGVTTSPGEGLIETTNYVDSPVFKSFRITGLKDEIDLGITLVTETYLDDTEAEKSVVKCYVKKGEKIVGEIGYLDDSVNGSYKLVDWSEITENYKHLYMIVYGNAEDDILTLEYVQRFLDEDEERRVLNTYFVSKYLFIKELVLVDGSYQLNPIDIGDKHIYGVILPKYPSNRALHISFSGFSDLNSYSVKSATARNIIKMTVYEDGAFHNESHPISIIGSLDINAVDANGSYIGFSNKNAEYSSQNLVYVYPRKTFKSGDNFNTQLSCYPALSLINGTREFVSYYKTKDTEIDTTKTYYVKVDDEYRKVPDPIKGDLPLYYEYTYDEIEFHNIGWELAFKNEYSDVDNFFDSALHEGETLTEISKSTFFSLAVSDKNSHELAGYWFNYTLSDPVLDKNYKLGFGRNYWNVCNIAIMELDSSGNRILSPMTGAKALMQCRIIKYRYGGVAPMWENSGSPAVGGQLTMISAYKLKYRYTKEQQYILDELNYNPVINDRQFGLMCVGHKTCKAGDITDWSYIGHVCSFITFLKEIKNNIMIPQIGKPNNPYYRSLRQDQVQQYLNKRLEGNNNIWAEGVVDVSTADCVNDVYALKARKFVINVKVKVNIYSEYVELNFTNEDQSTTISAV